VDCTIADVRAIVYTRQSQDRTGAGLAVARQQEACERLCAERGWTVLQVISDNDLSASTGKARPGYRELLQLVDERAAEVVVVWHVDRLVRRLADLEDVIARCEAAGVRLATVSGDVDLSTDAGRLVARILASVARGEVERKSARQQSAQAQAARQGRRVGGRRPFGFEQDGVTVRADEAAAIRSGYGDVLAGVPLAAVARDWNARGLTPGQARRDGRPSSWRHDNVRACLLNPRNAGIRRHRGEEVGPAVWPAIVPEETFRAVVGLITHPDRAHRPNAARALLSGIAVCGLCGTHVNGGRSRLDQRIYRCAVQASGHVGRQAEVVDDFVSGVIVERLSRADARELLHAPVTVDTESIRQEAQSARVRLEQLAVEFADGVLTGAQLRAATERLRSRIAELEGKLADAGRVDVLGPLLTGTDVRKAWDDLGVDRQRMVVATLLQVRLLPVGRGRRTFDPSTVEIGWKS
jgi:DNA invertase Pin-like site-specific DNA recombinase